MAASLAAPQEDVDRIGAGHYICCNLYTQTLMGLSTPREPVPNSPLSFLCELVKCGSGGIRLVFIFHWNIDYLYIAFSYSLSIGYPTPKPKAKPCLRYIHKNVICHVVYACDVLANGV